MRLVALLLFALAAAMPAAAQSWREYSYPQYSFAVSFPAEPKIEMAKYRTAEGNSVDARVYSVAQDNCLFKMTIADLSDLRTEEGTVIDHAIKTLSEGGQVKVDIPHRISRVYGRQLSVASGDGKHSSIAVFYYKRRLYQIEGVALPGSQDGTADAIRFQQSLIFTDDMSNRSGAGRLFEVLGRLF